MRAKASATLLFMLFLMNGCSGEGTGYAPPDPVLLANVTVSGSVTYEDREYGTGGYTGSVLTKAVRYARVEVVDPFTNHTMATTGTDASGAYSVVFNSTSIAGYVRVYSSTGTGPGPLAEVIGTTGGIYAAAGTVLPFSESGAFLYNAAITNANPVAGAFNILDVLVSGAGFANALSGSYPPALRAVWAPTSPKGTYYCTEFDYADCNLGEAIYLIGLYNDDSDTFDDDVIWHEYAHFLANHFSRDDSPGGFHSFDDIPQDLRLSWSEGWADHFTGAIKRWLRATDPSLLSTEASVNPEVYVDNLMTGAPNWIDMSDPGDTEPYLYATNEVSVAKMLLDIGDVFGGSQLTWDVFAAMNASSAVSSLEMFWDSWLDTKGVANLPEVHAALANREVHYEEDAYEAAPGDDLPDPARLIALNTAETHYLYKDDGSGDIDVLAFDALAGGVYNVETYCMKNGGDTLLRILDSDGFTVLSENDDRSYLDNYECATDGYTGYSSYIGNFVPAISNTYYIEVRANPKPCYLTSCTHTGSYGTYKVIVNGP